MTARTAGSSTQKSVFYKTSLSQTLVHIYILDLLLQLNSMKSSWAVSHVRCLYWTGVSRTILVIIIIRSLTWLIVQEHVTELVDLLQDGHWKCD